MNLFACQIKRSKRKTTREQFNDAFDLRTVVVRVGGVVVLTMPRSRSIAATISSQSRANATQVLSSAPAVTYRALAT